MKVVHTYATGDTGGPISKINFYNMILSAYYARRNYGGINLYGDTSAIKPLKDLGFEYLYDDIIQKSYHKHSLGAWSIPKVDTFASMTEPFLHIDTDTTFFKHIDFRSLNRHHANMFCYRDQPKDEFSDDNDGEILNKFMRGEYGYDAQARTYLYYYFTYWDYWTPEFKNSFDINSIPNMNVVYAEDYELIAEASQLALDFFNSFKGRLEHDREAACFLEQFLVHNYMRELDSDYKKASTAGHHVLFDNEPFRKWNMNNFGPVENYPCSVTYEAICNECTTTHGKAIEINSEEEVDKLYDSDMGGFFHMTSNRDAPLMESYLLHQLERVIGTDRVVDIHKYFKPQIEKMQQNPISAGELLYQKHKQANLF